MHAKRAYPFSYVRQRDDGHLGATPPVAQTDASTSGLFAWFMSVVVHLILLVGFRNRYCDARVGVGLLHTRAQLRGYLQGDTDAPTWTPQTNEADDARRRD